MVLVWTNYALVTTLSLLLVLYSAYCIKLAVDNKINIRMWFAVLILLLTSSVLWLIRSLCFTLFKYYILTMDPIAI